MKEKEATFFLLLWFIIMRVINESKMSWREGLNATWKEWASRF
jgi:hypothetical protein